MPAAMVMSFSKSCRDVLKHGSFLDRIKFSLLQGFLTKVLSGIPAHKTRAELQMIIGFSQDILITPPYGHGDVSGFLFHPLQMVAAQGSFVLLCIHDLVHAFLHSLETR